MVVAADEYRRLTRGTADFKELLLSGPDFAELGLDRPERDHPRPIEL